MMEQLYPSQLLASGARLAPISSMTAGHDDNCAFCGRPIATGDDCSPANDYLSNSFMDFSSMANQNGEYICDTCPTVFKKEWLMNYSKSAVTMDSVYKIASFENLLSMLLNPPAPPFMLFMSDAQQQHLVWRTPVNYSREVFHLRFGQNIVRVNRAHIQAAMDAQFRIMSVVSAVKKSKRMSIFDFSGAKSTDGLKGSYSISASVREVAAQNGLEKDIELLDSLSVHDKWMVSLSGWSGITSPTPYIKNPNFA